METKAEVPQLGVSLALTTLDRVAKLLSEEVSGLGTDLDPVMRDQNPCCEETEADRPSICSVARKMNVETVSLEKSLEMVRDFRSRLDL